MKIETDDAADILIGKFIDAWKERMGNCMADPRLQEIKDGIDQLNASESGQTELTAELKGSIDELGVKVDTMLGAATEAATLRAQLVELQGLFTAQGLDLEALRTEIGNIPALAPVFEKQAAQNVKLGEAVTAASAIKAKIDAASTPA